MGRDSLVSRDRGEVALVVDPAGWRSIRKPPDGHSGCAEACGGMRCFALAGNGTV
jgi:hypothetical protein